MTYRYESQDTTPDMVHWAESFGEDMRRRGPIAPLESMAPTETIVLGTQVLWLVRPPGEERLHVYHAVDSTAKSIGVLDVLAHNPNIRAAAVGPRDVVLITGQIATTDSDPPAVSVATRISVRCAWMKS